MRFRSFLLTASLAALACGLVAAIAGCGGSSKSSTGPSSGTALPVALGRQTTGATKGFEVSGLGLNTPNPSQTSANPALTDTAYLTFAFASNSTPLGGAVLLGYLGLSPAGAYIDQATAQNPITPPTIGPSAANVFFRARIALGTDPNTGQQIPIRPNGVVLTTPEAGLGAFSEVMSNTTYNANTAAGPFSAAEYVTPPFTLPFTTPGVHILRVTETDAENNAPHTDFAVIVLDNATAAVVTTIPATATATITGPAAPQFYTSTPANPTTAFPDNQGVVVLFATPGAPDGNGNTNTITVDDNGTLTNIPVKLTAGQAIAFASNAP
jgi:hypothetical protein